MKISRQRRCFVEARAGQRPFYAIAEDQKIVAISPDKPCSIEIYPTLRCNLLCPTCDRGQDASELKDFRNIKILYDNLSRDPDFHLSEFKISGREPTLFPRINGLIAYLRRLDAYAAITVYTNGINLNKLTPASFKKIGIQVSVYPYSVEFLRQDPEVVRLLQWAHVPIEPNVRRHDVLESPGKIKNKLDPFVCCLSAVLLCGTKKVYPCCRAHRFEQMHHKKYHCFVATPGLYGKLKDIINHTDLCDHCPRTHKDAKTVKI